MQYHLEIRNGFIFQCNLKLTANALNAYLDLRQPKSKEEL